MSLNRQAMTFCTFLIIESLVVVPHRFYGKAFWVPLQVALDTISPTPVTVDALIA